MKMYYKYQGFYLVIALAFFIHSLFFYIQNNYNETIAEEHFIVNKRCSAAPRISSFIEIEKQKKIYTVNLSEQDCRSYSVGQKILLNYNKKYDYFFYPDSSRIKVEIFRILISSIIVFLLLLPWKYMIKK